MDLQEAIKISIQKYFSGEDVQSEGGKYTKSYLDTFHETVAPSEEETSEKDVKKALKSAKNLNNKNS